MNITKEAYDKLISKIQELDERLAKVEGIRRKPTLTELDRGIYEKLSLWLKNLNVYDYQGKANEYWNRFGSYPISKALKDSMTTNTINFEKCCKYHKKEK